MIKEGKIAGRAVLIAGTPGTGSLRDPWLPLCPNFSIGKVFFKSKKI
jgi:hypothetical protein